MLYKAPRTTVVIPQGSFTVYANFPGYNVPGYGDHGYGPLSAIAESLLEPDTWIPPHEHANEDIISWVPHGVMRHNDRTVGELITDPNHLMVMNAGKGFWHEERTLADDPHLRMLQIFVGPHTLDLEPGIQHGRLTPPIANEWRHLFGADAPFSVRNNVHLYDIRLDEGVAADLPLLAGWDTYFYAFTGAVEVGNTRFGEAESGLLREESGFAVEAKEDAMIVAFLIDPEAKVTRAGTVGR
jgi:quercetin 2,3-dioxygenase